MALAGVTDVYSQSNDLLNAFLGINISESQVHRVTDYLGQATSDDVTKEIKHPQLAEEERVYASLDGSMIQMDHGWQEAKLGRIYRETSRKKNGEKNGTQIRYRLDDSTYSAHLGAYTDFIPKFESSLGNYKDSEGQIVFITDGAIWIQKYLTSRFPNSTHILDYFHAVEHLSDFAKLYFGKEVEGKKWIKTQEKELLEGSPEVVIKNLFKLNSVIPEVSRAKSQLIEYYQNNFGRINYKEFRSRGLAIGSGPMEAAHRTVIQKRMKRSGQRWTNNGAQAMLNLRVLKESNRWNCVYQILSEAA
jgi:hypothetical protein